MLNDDELKQKMDASPAARVTEDDIKSHIVETENTRFSDTVTVCQITLDNGYSVRGESACVNAENYNQDIGERIAYDNAFSKLWALYGFLLAETQLADSNSGAKSEAA